VYWKVGLCQSERYSGTHPNDDTADPYANYNRNRRTGRLKFHLVNHFHVLKNLSNLFLNGFLNNRFNTGDGGTGIIRFILQIMNNTGHPGKADTTGTTAGAVQYGTTNIIEDGFFLKPDSTFL